MLVRKTLKNWVEKFCKGVKMTNEMEKPISRVAKMPEKIAIKTSHTKPLHAQAKILYALISAGEPLNFNELKRRANVSASALYRNIPVLVNHGYVKMLEETCKLSRQKFAIGTYTLELDEETKNKILLLLNEVYHKGWGKTSIQWIAENIKKPITNSAKLFIYEEARKRGVKISEREESLAF
jgi:predicted transcriptional regulator